MPDLQTLPFRHPGNACRDKRAMPAKSPIKIQFQTILYLYGQSRPKALEELTLQKTMKTQNMAIFTFLIPIHNTSTPPANTCF